MEKKLISGRRLSTPKKNCMSKVAPEPETGWQLLFLGISASLCHGLGVTTLSSAGFAEFACGFTHLCGHGRASFGGCAWCLVGNHIKAS